jgi:hypothetical protein
MVKEGSRWWIGLVLLGVAGFPAAGHAQASVRLPGEDRIRLAEARRLADQVCERIWPGWGRTAFPILLVSDSAEFLVGHRPPAGEFTTLGYDALLRSVVWSRARQFPPTLLATFPAVGGVPTVVIGSAARTGKSSTAWVLSLLHEHFHQWQYSQPDYYAAVSRLELAHGDTTGRWMLEYAFPYDSAPVQQAVRSLATALARALDTPPDARVESLRAVIHVRDALRSRLGEADYRYLEFQLWQEGVARFIEYAVARAAATAGEPSKEFQHLADHQSYGTAAHDGPAALRQELERLDLARDRRIAFYPIGAAVAVLLEETRTDWKQVYARRPFALAVLLSADR